MPEIARLSTRDPDFDARLAAPTRLEASQDEAVDRAVAAIVDDVRLRGDAAVLEYTRRFDRVDAASVAELEIPRPERERALAELDRAVRDALAAAAARIRAYHERQGAESWSYAESDGTVLGQRVTPLDRVGLYVPGGQAAYH